MFAKKPTRFGSWRMVDQTAHWPAFAGPNKAFASCLHYIICTLTSLIRSCRQGLNGMEKWTYPYRNVLVLMAIMLKNNYQMFLNIHFCTYYNFLISFHPLQSILWS